MAVTAMNARILGSSAASIMALSCSVVGTGLTFTGAALRHFLAALPDDMATALTDIRILPSGAFRGGR